ncbi:hypothetical protein [Extibacter muris]|uniref:hypothetical protein n=1 Tax=Extibacter muris TaxID=1796622 RepID=UPI00142E4EBF|nr:hypothetical protein [Extibacter muris]MCU0081364.1 hypothetical protein [Extibacter muris]
MPVEKENTSRLSLQVPLALDRIQLSNNKEDIHMEKTTSFIPEIYIGEYATGT